MLFWEKKAKLQLVRDSKKDIDISITDLQKHPLNYTQVTIVSFFSFLSPLLNASIHISVLSFDFTLAYVSTTFLVVLSEL
jgi:F-type H+-transporting ATPase subunit gamma